MHPTKIKFKGKALTLSEWADELGIANSTMTLRLKRLNQAGSDREVFLSTMAAEQKAILLRERDGRHDATHAKKYAGKTTTEWAEEKGVSRQAIHLRLQKVGTKYKSVKEAMDF